MAPTLSEAFNEFAGKEVKAFDEANDPTIRAIREKAADYGWSLRCLWQGVDYTDDSNGKRLNVRLEKGADGKYRVGKEFYCG